MKRDPSIVFISLGAFGREGGMERVNQRVIRCLNEFQSEGLLSDVSAVLYLDSKQHFPKDPLGKVELVAGKSHKQWFKLASAIVTARRRPDVVIYGHISVVSFVLLARLLSRRARHILLVHGVEVWRRPHPMTRRIVARFIDVVVAVSTFTSERMAAVFELEPTRFRVLGLTVDSQGDIAREVSLPEAIQGKSKILTVARLVEEDAYKNVDKVVLAMPELLQSNPDLHYFVVGDGDLRAELEELARQVGVENHTHFLGAVTEEDKTALFRACDVFVLPSTGEGFGLVYLEAWDACIPVVAADSGGAAEVVRDGIDGFAVPPTPTDIAAALGKLLDDPQLRRRMGESGNRRYHENFGHQRFKERLWEILSEQLSHNTVTLHG